MKKIIIFLLLSLVSYANCDNFKCMTTEYVYSVANKNKEKAEKLKEKMFQLDKNLAQYVENSVQNTEKVLVRIFKTEKNLVPKVIKYIYFEPDTITNKKILTEETKNILVTYYSNEKAYIIINSNSKISKYFKELLLKRGVKDTQIILLNEDPKEAFEYIKNLIIKNTNKNEFTRTELRIALLVNSKYIKERLSLAYPIFNKEYKGIEIDDFSYLTTTRKDLEYTSNQTRLQSFKEMLRGIK